MMRVEQNCVVNELGGICTVGNLRRAIEGLPEDTPTTDAAGGPLVVTIVTPLDLNKPVFVEVV